MLITRKSEALTHNQYFCLFLAALDDEDQDMEDIAMINFDPAMLSVRDAGGRETGNVERSDRRRRNFGGRTRQLSRSDRRRRQQSSSAVIREAAALGGVLGRAASGRGLQLGNRIGRRSRSERQINGGNLDAAVTESQENVPNSENVNDVNLASIRPSTSSESPPPNRQSNDEHKEKTSDNSNSSWEDVSEEEVGGSGDNSSARSNNEGEANETTASGDGSKSPCEEN